MRGRDAGMVQANSRRDSKATVGSGMAEKCMGRVSMWVALRNLRICVCVVM